jgi:hypothetical protein
MIVGEEVTYVYQLKAEEISFSPAKATKIRSFGAPPQPYGGKGVSTIILYLQYFSIRISRL